LIEYGGRRLAHGHSGSCCYRRTLLGVVRTTFCKDVRSLGAADGSGRGISAQEFLQTRLEHAALRLDVGAEILDPPPHLALELAQALILCRDELVVPPLELLPDVRDPVLEPLRARVSDVRQPFREHRLGFPREC